MITAAIWLAELAFLAEWFWLGLLSERAKLPVSGVPAVLMVIAFLASTGSLVLATIAVNR